jgi:hypothetical protein
MRKSFKVAPGVRIRASSRGISAGVGPRAARVHVGTRGVGVSSGVGPLSANSRFGGGGRRTSGGARRAPLSHSVGLTRPVSVPASTGAESERSESEMP